MEDLTLGNYMERWAEWKYQTKYKTEEKREWAITHTKELADIELSRLNAHHFRELMSSKLNTLAGSSVQILYDVINQALDDAVDDVLIESNPLESVDRPKRGEAEFYVLSKQEMTDVLHALKQATKFFSDELSGDFPNFHHFYSPIHTLMHTGMRLGELLGLKEDDLYLDAGTIRIDRQLKCEDGEHVFHELKSPSSHRTIHMTPENQTMIENYLQVKRMIEKEMGWQDAPVLFTSRTGYFITRSSIRRSLNKACKRAGMTEDARIHDLRHTHASHLLRCEGVTVEDVRDRLGHSKTQTLLNYYVHATTNSRESTAEAFQEEISMGG